MKKILPISFIILLTGLISCDKEGKATIEGQIAHHDVIIPNAKIYIKFGTNVFPGQNVSVYDVNTITNSEGFYSIENMHTGLHYAFAVGYDPGISDSVFGGIPFEIKLKKSILKVNIPVTE